MLINMKRVFTTKDHVKLVYNYNPSKNKNPVLFYLHGLGGNWSEWERSLETAQKDGYGTIALDMRGHGLSSVPEDEKSYAIERFAEDVRNILIKEKIKDYVLIGHSFGGCVVVVYCTKYNTDMPKAVIFVETTHRYPYQIYHEMNNNPILCFSLRKLINWKVLTNKYFPRRKEMNIPKILKENVVFQLFDEMYHTPFKAVFNCLDSVKDYSEKSGKLIEKALHNLKIPTLIIGGKKDSVIDYKFSEEMHKIIPNSKLKIFDNATHMFPVEDPKTFNLEIFSFLSTI